MAFLLLLRTIIHHDRAHTYTDHSLGVSLGTLAHFVTTRLLNLRRIWDKGVR